MNATEILKKYWGYDNFRPLQLEIIEAVLSKKDTLALLPTGGGKSICFQIPALQMEGICIVISPLIALMKDQVEALNKKGIKAVSVTSGMTKREIDIALDNCIFGPIKFLYLSPERLFSDLVTERIKHMKVNLLAVDEAHCISQWGYDFRPAYLKIVKFRNLHPNVPILALTASATEIVQQDIVTQLLFKNPLVFKKSFNRLNLSYSVLKLDNKLQKLLDVCRNVKGTGIVYVNTRKETFEIATFLNQNQIIADYYHAGLDIEQRAFKQDSWINNKIKVIVATNAFGMGIDKPDVRFVLHYTLPQSLEAYYQEAGRAGRDEKKAYAVILFQKQDKLLFEKKFVQSFPPISEIKKIYHAIANYFQLAIGAGEGLTFDFNVADFCSKFKFDILVTLSAIKFLEYNQYLALSEQTFLPSRIQFLVNGQDLYRYQVENVKFDSFIKTILRMYGGTFDQYVPIKESDIAKKTSLPTLQVKINLRQLSQDGMLAYAEQSNQPQLYFIKARLDTSRLEIDKSYYQNRKETFEQKMKSMLAYVEDEKCRNVSLLHYFDEIDAKKCGICDVCIRQNKEENGFIYEICEQIETLLQQQHLSLDELLSFITKGNANDKIAALRLLLDHEKVVKIGNEYQKNHV